MATTGTDTEGLTVVTTRPETAVVVVAEVVTNTLSTTDQGL